MQLVTRNLHPVYFTEDRSVHSNIWGQELVLKPGERVHIVAPSGSGKTSFIHFLYGLRKEYNGSIQYDGKDIRSLAPDQLAVYRQKHLSIIFQDLRLFPDQTVAQNIEIKRQLQPYHPANKIEEFAGRLGVAHKLNMLCSTCSYGEQQRVAIIRSLMQPFDFILMDEPVSNLDENNRKKAIDLIVEEAAHRNAGIVLADLKKLEYFPADKILHL
ncbi:MAG TPA: ATP-binding cassette domain-containing protein [Chitinophagaceae bacterium]|nr:ATP-binding cassette domain-containing protein [Chitinophagaceae bacterium]